MQSKHTSQQTKHYIEKWHICFSKELANTGFERLAKKAHTQKCHTDEHKEPHQKVSTSLLPSVADHRVLTSNTAKSTTFPKYT